MIRFKFCDFTMKFIFFICTMFVIPTNTTVPETTELALRHESNFPIAERILTLPFFSDNVAMTVDSFSSKYVRLHIANNSEYGLLFWNNIPYWSYGIGNIDIDYFDGRDRRTLTHSAAGLEFEFGFGGPGRVFVSPGGYSSVEHSLAGYPLSDLPESESLLLRIRKPVYLDPAYFPSNLITMLRAIHAEDDSIWFELPPRPPRNMAHVNTVYGSIQPRHIITVEFYWDGETFHPRQTH